MRLFLVGFPKAGTTTIHKAIVKSGLTSIHWKGAEGFVGDIIYRNYMHGADPLEQLTKYDAITQADVCLPAREMNFWPQLDLAVLESIRLHHPNCAFVLNWRRPADIAHSMLHWPGLAGRLALCDIPGLPKGFGERSEHLVRWIEGHYRAVRQSFQGDPNFHEVDISSEEAPKILSQVMGVEIAWWGKANVSRKIG